MLITSLTGNTAKKKLFKSFGVIPQVVVLVFVCGCLLVSRLIARHIIFEFLLFAKMSAIFYILFLLSDRVGGFISFLLLLLLFVCCCFYLSAT